jgi:hypothetical protein
LENLKESLGQSQFFGKKCDDRLVGCTINRRSRDPDIEPGRITKLTNNLVFGGPRLNDKAQGYSVAMVFDPVFH